MKSSNKLNIYAALLRGINVGGKGIMKMSDLKSGFESLGFENVKTYIQSGNVIFQTAERNQRQLEKEIEDMVLKKHKHTSKAVVRNIDEMENVVKNMPTSWKNSDTWKHNILFLRHSIDSKEILKELNPKPNIEIVLYKPGVLYWSAKMSDITRSSMVKLSSKPIYQEVTVRNVNTTKKILELMQSNNSENS